VQVETVAGRSSGDFTVDLPPDALLEQLRSRLATQKRFTVVQADASGVQLNARPNLATWGGRIELRFVPVGATSTLVKGRWSPALPTTIGIWGQGARDLRALEVFARP
jgi:hypothetical protein